MFISNLLISATGSLIEILPFLIYMASFIGGIFCVFVIAADVDHIAATIALGIGAFLAFSAPLGFTAVNLFAHKLDLDGLPLSTLLPWLIVLSASIIVSLYSIRFATPVIEKLKKKLTLKTSLERNTKIDVRKIADYLPEGGKVYNPEKYFQKNDYFLGLDESNKPIYLEQPRLPHIQIAGTTGTGKGVFIGILEAQALKNGATVVNIDPKNDEFGAYVLLGAAQKAGVPYYFIDLRPEAPPQLNFFKNSSEFEIYSLFESAFGLGMKGGDSDFYRIADRRAAKFISKQAVKSSKTPAQLYLENEQELTKDAPGFGGYLEEMAELAAINAVDGLDLDTIIADGAAVYVIGSTRNSAVIAAQRMLLVKLIQIAERRERTGDEKPRQIMAVVDELSYQISGAVLESLKTSRDKGLNLILAHQSMSDLRSGPKDLDPNAVEGAVMENGSLKLIYRVQDPELCKKLAEKSGKIQVDDEARTVRKNIALAETVDGERTIRQSERDYIHADMIANLPKGVGVLFGVGLPQFVQTSPMHADRSPEAYEVHETEGKTLDQLREADKGGKFAQ